MQTIYYRKSSDRQYTPENVNPTLLDFIKTVAPKRPQYRFLFTYSSTCLVYFNDVDITGADKDSARYIGFVETGSVYNRGGVSRRKIRCCPRSGSDLATSVTNKAVKFFLDSFKGLNYDSVARQAAKYAISVVLHDATMCRRDLMRAITDEAARLTDATLVNGMSAILDAINAQTGVMERLEKLRIHGKTFGYDRSCEHLTCVTEMDQTYLVCDNDNSPVYRYTHETLPEHLARAIGMLKVSNTMREIIPGYGMRIDQYSFAVTKREEPTCQL